MISTSKLTVVDAPPADVTPHRHHDPRRRAWPDDELVDPAAGRQPAARRDAPAAAAGRQRASPWTPIADAKAGARLLRDPDPLRPAADLRLLGRDGRRGGEGLARDRGAAGHDPPEAPARGQGDRARPARPRAAADRSPRFGARASPRRPARSRSTAHLIGAVALSLFWFVLGYAFYAAAYAVAGALVPRQEEIQSSTTPLTMLILISLFAGFAVNENPDGHARATSRAFIPPMAPVTMPSRIILGAAPAWEIAASIAVMLARDGPARPAGGPDLLRRRAAHGFGGQASRGATAGPAGLARSRCARPRALRRRGTPRPAARAGPCGPWSR